MSRTTSALTRWGELNGLRSGFIRRCEGFASLTIRKLCLPEGYDQYSTDLQHDWQSVGAQSVNHLSNKLMLALFAPSRPFFRLDPTREFRKELTDAGVDEAQLSEALSAGEQEAVKELDQSASRPKLYEILKHLVVTGNSLMVLNEGMRVMGIKHYCVKRAADGRLLELLIRECVKFDELDPAVQLELGTKDPDTKVQLFKWICRGEKDQFKMSTHVDDTLLSSAFTGTWPEDKMPYRVLTWDLADDSDYGTGLVEDYAGDFQALSALSEAQVTAAILASEFRWLVNPAGMTKAEDFTASRNGSALPGVSGDVSLVQSGKAQDLQVIQLVAAEYIQRIGRGFLLGSAVTRNAERVTAVEMRMQAEELETSFGGAYSRLAVDMQRPISLWLIKRVDIKFNGKQFTPVIVTGLDALSRSGDLENMLLFLQDLSGVAQLPPALQNLLKMRALAQMFAAARGVKSSQFLKSDAELQAEQQAAQAQATAAEAQSAGVQAAAQQQVQGMQPQ